MSRHHHCRAPVGTEFGLAVLFLIAFVLMWMVGDLSDRIRALEGLNTPAPPAEGARP